MDLDRIYGGQLLRNFQVDFLQSTLTGFFDSKTTFNRVWKENLCENGWLKASDLIEKCDVFNSEQSLIKLEAIFYDELVNNVPDYTHLYPISLRDQVCMVYRYERYC
ncbi:hypothetical protein MKY88_10095 [Lysinibacillus sp. FSL R7-0073]|uniref:hypothetical protein n=1 Tax=Lysinibacillus sp. FSL R7-0073 TaxID=2921669 RepID=UPI0030FC2B76